MSYKSLFFLVLTSKEKEEVNHMDKCDNKKELYICRDTPKGLDCTRVDKLPSNYSRKVTFVEEC